MNVELEARLKDAFDQRAASTPIAADPAMRDRVVAAPPRPWWPLVAAAVLVVGAVIAGLALLARTPAPDRRLSSPSFDGQPFLVDPERFVPLGLSGVPGWELVSSTDHVDTSSTPYCNALTANLVCTDFVGATRATYRRSSDGARVEITNEFGPERTTSNLWQMTGTGQPITVRGHDGGAFTLQGSDIDRTIGWSETDDQHLVLGGPAAMDADQLAAIAATLVPSPQPIHVELIAVRTIDIDDHEPSSVGPGTLALVAGRIDGHTCVALLGANGDDRCESGLDFGDGPTAAVGGRVIGSQDESFVAAILPAEAASVRVDRLDLPAVDVQPITIDGFPERFVLATMGTTFPTRLHAFDAAGTEIAAYDVDPLHHASLARGTIDGRAWDLAMTDGCLTLTDVNGSASDCAAAVPDATDLTVGGPLGHLQFGRAGARVAAVEVAGTAYPTIEVPGTGQLVWIAPTGDWPTPLDADGRSLLPDEPEPPAPADVCATMTSVADGTTPLEEVFHDDWPPQSATLTARQRLLLGVAVNGAVVQYQASGGRWDTTKLVAAIDQICNPQPRG